jgi:hypothetical protein
MARYEFWTHGVNTAVEFPSRAAEIRRAGWGTLVRQPANTDNWFHIALPTAKVVNNESALMREIHLKAEVNENARIDMIHCRDDGKLAFSRAVSFTDRVVDQVFQSADFPMSGGLALCIHIDFLTGTPMGQVIFRSAGAAFLT